MTNTTSSLFCPNWSRHSHKKPITLKHSSLYEMAHSINSGTTHTDIVYDDNGDDYDKYGTVYDYAYDDSFNINDPSLWLQFQKCLQAVQHHNDTVKKYTQATPEAPPQQPHPRKNTTELTHAGLPPSKHTMSKHTHEDLPPPYMYNLLQLLFLTTYILQE